MSRIYAEMFLADQQIMQNGRLQRMADTSRVYEAIFDKYGYTLEDYRASQEKYLLDARRYAKMLKKSVDILEKENKVLKDEKQRLDAISRAKEGILRHAPNRIFLLDTLAGSQDSLLVFDFQKGLDTIFEGPRIIVAADTVLVADSVETDNDSVSPESLEGKPVLSDDIFSGSKRHIIKGDSKGAALR